MARVQERHQHEMDDTAQLHEQNRQRLETKIRELEAGASRPAGGGPRVLRSASTASLGSEMSDSLRGGHVVTGPRSQEAILSELHLGESSRTLPETEASQTPTSPGALATGSGGGQLEGSAPSMLALQQLQATVHQKQGQIESLKAQMANIERARDALSDELVRYSERVQVLEKQAQRVPELEQQLHETGVRFDALLQVYGEKEEELEELQESIAVLKASHRQQLDHMTAVLGAGGASPAADAERSEAAQA